MAQNKAERVSSGFAMVETKDGEVDFGVRGKYSKLVTDFVDNFKPGTIISITHEDGSALSEDDVKRMYASIQQYILYKRKKGVVVPANVHRNIKEGKLYLERLGD